MDRNTIIGFVLIGLLMMGMFYFNSKDQNAYLAQKKREEDSLAKLKPKVDTIALAKDSAAAEAIRKSQAVGGFQFSLTQPEVLTTVENKVLKITFSNKGAQPVSVELKNYKGFNGGNVIVQNGGFNKLSYDINSGENRKAATADMMFAPAVKSEDAQGQTISFSLKDSTGKEIIHQYQLKPDDYMLDLSIKLNNAESLITKNYLALNWQIQTNKVEKDMHYEKQQTELSYSEGDKFDFERMGMSSGDKKFDEPLSWLAVKQQFFIAALSSKDKFKTAETHWVIPTDTTKPVLAQTSTLLGLALPQGNQVQIPLQLYYGPSDYNILKRYNNGMQQIVPYGSGIFSFVKYINRHLLLPVFDLLRKNVASMGIVILLLTLFIRLLTSPILYKSYLSGAKMKVLKPEVDALKARFTDKSGTLDQQAFSMEQMKLWRSAGVSPFGGCLPALLQIPIFMSLYYFFQSNISLRGQKFLWANDLAQYDSVLNLPFNIPFYGDHVSLFTLTATATSLLISIYSMSNMQDNSNPVMKYMPYIFPVLLLGVFNNLPAALTWYYTVSNTITLLLQIIIQKYIINHDKIMTEIAENRKKPVKQNKWQERLQAMQAAQQKAQDTRTKQQGR